MQQTVPKRRGPPQTLSRYAGRVELLCGWHGSLLQPHAVCMTTRGLNKQRETHECTPMCITLPSLSLYLLWLCCAFINNHEENPAGCYDTFPRNARMTTLLQQCVLSTRLGKQTPRMRKPHALLIRYPLSPIFPLLRWEDGESIKTLHPT